MDTVSLSAKPRTERRKATNQLRRDGLVPAVVYGHGQEPIAITLERKIFDKIYGQAGENTIVNLNVEGTGEIKTLIKDVFRDPVSDNSAHVDFLKINLKEKLETSIPVEITGESPAVKNHGGVLVHNMTEVDVRCLPTDLVHSFTLDIGTLDEFGAMLTVADIKVPEGIEILNEPETVVVSVAAPKAEEAASVPAESIAPSDIPTTEQKAPEEGAAAEGGDKGEKKEKKSDK